MYPASELAYCYREAARLHENGETAEAQDYERQARQIERTLAQEVAR